MAVVGISDFVRGAYVPTSRNVSRMAKKPYQKTINNLSVFALGGVLDGQRYLVSMLGNDAQWVQNVCAAAGRAVLRSGGREEVELQDVPADRRAPILKAYLQRAPGARPHVPVSKDAAVAEFEKVAEEFPVFRLISSKTVQQR